MSPDVDRFNEDTGTANEEDMQENKMFGAPLSKSERQIAIDRLCRDALLRFKSEAFDNIDVASLLAQKMLTTDDAKWVAKHLMSEARSLQAYSAGQAIAVEIEAHDAY